MGFEFYRLKNGVRACLVPMQGVKSVVVGVFVSTGSRYETPQINGISHFLEHMVFKGTTKYPTHEDTSYLEGLGAIQNAWTDVDGTAYWAKLPANRWYEGLELVKELALNPLIPEKDLEIERGVVLEEINRRDDRPDEIVSEELFKLIFEGNPLQMTVLGTPEVIKTVTRNQFLEYHSVQYVAENIVVVIAGDIVSSGQRLASSIEEWFGEMPKKAGLPLEYAKIIQNGPQVRVLKKDLAAQAHIELAVRGITNDDPDRFALSVLTTYLGQGLSSRLFIELREKRGLCYAVQASEERFVDTGVWGVYAGLNIAKLEDAIVAILAELKKLKNTRISHQDFEKAKEKMRGPLLFSMENPINQMNFYAKQIMDRPNEILSYEDVEKKINEVTPEMIQKVAQRIFKTQFLNLAIVGPVDKKRVEKVRKLLTLD